MKTWTGRWSWKVGIGVLGVGMVASASPAYAQKGSPAPAVRPGAKGVNGPGLAGGNGGPAKGNESPSSVIPEVVGTVNGVPITKQVLAQSCVERYGQVVLENMLNKYLIQQSCVAQNINITKEDVNNEIAKIATKFNLSTAAYLKLIEDERSIKPEMYASDIVWPMLALRALARDKIQVSEDLIDKRFENEFGPTVKVRMIALENKGQAPAKMQQIYQQVTADPNQFKRIAKEQSEEPNSASVEGLLPPIRKNSGDDELEKVAFGLQPGQISNIFEVNGMILLLQGVAHLPPSPPNAEQVPAMRQRIRSSLEDELLQSMADEMFGKLREGSTIVKVLGNPEQQKQYPGVAAIINRQQVPMAMLEEECVRRHGVQVLDGEIHRVLLESLLQAAKLQVTQADIDREIALAADRFGFIKSDRTPDVERWLNTIQQDEGTTVELYVKDAVWPSVALKKLIADKVKLTDEDIRRGYETDYGPRAEVLAIVLSNQRTAQEVWQMARGKNDEQFFGELASQYSVEPASRSNYGKVPPIRRHGIGPTLEKAAFDLKPGEMSGIIEVNGQYVILRLQGFTNPVAKDINVVRAELEKDLLERKTRLVMETFLEDQIKGSDIQNFLDPSKSHAGVISQASREQARQAK